MRCRRRVSVSYTHLDVYKRQIPSRPYWAARWFIWASDSYYKIQIRKKQNLSETNNTHLNEHIMELYQKSGDSGIIYNPKYAIKRLTLYIAMCYHKLIEETTVINLTLRPTVNPLPVPNRNAVDLSGSLYMGGVFYAIHAPASANPQTRAYSYIYSNIGAAYGFFLRKSELICKQYA